MSAPFRVLVTGSRGWPDENRVRTELDRVFGTLDNVPMRVVHGMCPKGADLFAARWVKDRIAAGTLFPSHLREEPYPAQWGRHGRRAGILRNQQMVDRGADLCLAFIVDDSPGATHCVGAAKKAAIPVRLFIDPVVPVPKEPQDERRYGIAGLIVQQNDGTVTRETRRS